ncbi:DMT family transporter [Terrilactibacillus laevilacticus]|uniref:DMT family transporter n=1 Tax=Terrilactibacillus laevilacticus TaxID=1380157 RepID=A0ABW5PT90_9BACI|nr:DMT family transporter [Terrilactibacillus laevilacticus]
MKIRDLCAMFGLAALWGASFLFMRIAAPVLGPILTIESRVSIAAIALIIYIIFIHHSIQLKKWWKEYLIIGTLNAALPFTLIATAELHLNASMSSILNSLTPLCTALVVWIWLKEKLTLKKWSGIFVGIIGVIILVGFSPIEFTKINILSIGLSVLSTVCYGISGVYAKKTFTHVPPLSLAIGQQLGAAIVMIPFSLIFVPESTRAISTVIVFSIIGLAIFCTSIAYLLYFYLLNRVGPTNTLSVTFLIPVFGMIWGSLFLHEIITLNMIIGLLIILASILLIYEVPLKITRTQKHIHH